MSERTYNALRIGLFAAMIVFGLYTAVRYMSIPVHQSVLLSDSGQAAIADGCPGGEALCEGSLGSLLFLWEFFTRLAPFLPYILLSVVLFGVIAFLQYMKHGEWKLRFQLTPLHILGGSLALLWVLFTTLTYGGLQESITRVYEPVPQVYAGAGEEGLQVLEENFARLQSAGCLTEIGTTGVGSGVFQMSRLCMQQSFFTRVLPQFLIVLYLFFVFAVMGRPLLNLLIKKDTSPLIEWAFSTGLGASALIVLLWAIALIGALTGSTLYNSTVGWVTLLALPLVLFKQSLYWIRSLYTRKWEYNAPLYGAVHGVFWVLMTFFVLNFLNVVRPFPIGWDDLGRYLNAPRVLVSYGYLIPQLGVYQWEYITSLGFLLFGYDSVFGATTAMIINWSAGLLAVIPLYAMGRTFFGKGGGVLSALLYYSLPLVGHFSFADMKVDNAVFAMGMFALFALWIALFHTPDSDKNEEKQSATLLHPRWRWIMLAGVLSGMVFSLKATGIMVIMAMGAVLFGAIVHWSGFMGAMFLAWYIFARNGQLNFATISERVYGNPEVLNGALLQNALLVLGLGFLAYAAYIRLKQFKTAAVSAGVFLASFFITVAPWLLHNNYEEGNVVPKAVLSVPNSITPLFVIGKDEAPPPSYGQDIVYLPEELRVDQSQCVGTSRSEELDRYWGYGSGWSHYLGLPWRTVMNIDSFGYYVTTYPALLFLPLLLLIPFLWRKEGTWLRWLTFATIFLLAQWMFFANGVPWYGIAIFMGLCMGLEALILRGPDTANRIAAGVFIAFSLMIAITNRVWQYELQENIFEYPVGKVSAEAMRERTIPYYDDVREIIEDRIATMPAQPYVYRIGTFIPYFIPQNLEVLPVADHQLDMFNCLYQEEDPALTVRRLQALGFNSIIFDTNTHTIEQTPGSLHRKVQKFVDFVNTPETGLQLKINKPENGIAFILIPPVTSAAENQDAPQT